MTLHSVALPSHKGSRKGGSLGELHENTQPAPEVAMCVSSLLHRNMTLQDRAEAGLAGFLSLDLFRMVAEEKAEELAVPRGSLFMSGQTCFNIQGVALSATVLTLCKDANWHPWKQGTCRLSELPVEEWFSLLRRQSSSSQLSARGYFAAGARTMMKHGKLLNNEKPMERKPEKSLTEDECLDRIGFAVFAWIRWSL